jgi:hypothetical protein
MLDTDAGWTPLYLSTIAGEFLVAPAATAAHGRHHFRDLVLAWILETLCSNVSLLMTLPRDETKTKMKTKMKKT